jgi:hypothetical protein
MLYYTHLSWTKQLDFSCFYLYCVCCCLELTTQTLIQITQKPVDQFTTQPTTNLVIATKKPFNTFTNTTTTSRTTHHPYQNTKTNPKQPKKKPNYPSPKIPRRPKKTQPPPSQPQAPKHFIGGYSKDLKCYNSCQDGLFSTARDWHHFGHSG